MPISGGGDTIRVKNIKHVPQLVYHGKCDDIIPISASMKMADALARAGADEVRFSRYPEATHNSWTNAYNDVEVWRWMLSHRWVYDREEIGEDDRVIVPEEKKVQIV